MKGKIKGKKKKTIKCVND